jgi:hypothetical protein
MRPTATATEMFATVSKDPPRNPQHFKWIRSTSGYHSGAAAEVSRCAATGVSKARSSLFFRVRNFQDVANWLVRSGTFFKAFFDRSLCPARCYVIIATSTTRSLGNVANTRLLASPCAPASSNYRTDKPIFISFLLGRLWQGSGGQSPASHRQGLFSPSSCMWFVVDKVALRRVFLPVLRFSPVSTFPPILHTHSSTTNAK